MKTNNMILSELQSMIINNDNNILDFMLKHQNTIFRKDDIVNFLESLSSKKDYKHYYTISGSGGSKIIKPNITSIAFLYIASLGIPIVKTGSKAITGIHGSTDFFAKLNLLNKDVDNEIYHFAYYDGYAVSLWKKHQNLLSINKSFKEYFAKNIFHDYELKSKISIQLSEKSAEKYLKKEMNRVPEKLFVIYNDNSEFILDEIVGGKIYVNNQNEYELKNNSKYQKLTTLKEIEQINNDLIFGNEMNNLFWYNSLKFEVSLFLYLNDFVNTIEEGEDIFKKSFQEKKVKEMLEYCGIID